MIVRNGADFHQQARPAVGDDEASRARFLIRNPHIIKEMREKEVIEACKLIINFLDSEMEEDGLMSETLENQLCALEDRLKW